MKRISIIIVILILLLIALFYGIDYAISNGYTNAESKEETIFYTHYYPNTIDVPKTERRVYKYLEEHSENTSEVNKAYIYMHNIGSGNMGPGRFPSNMENDKGFMFPIKGIYAKENVIKEIRQTSELLGIDPDIVISSILGEQIRITAKGARGNMKGIILGMTPRWVRSYNVSLGIGGIKLTTAQQIKRDADRYGYGKKLPYATTSGLADNDVLNAKYATYLVKNIIHKRELEGYDISNNPGVVGTIYNIGNHINPHNGAKVGGAIIRVGGKDYTYGGISMVCYWYIKIYINNKQ